MRIVLVTSRFPLPAWRGNQVRTAEWMEALEEHDVCIVCPQPEHHDRGALSGQCCTYKLTSLASVLGLGRAIFSGLPFQEGLYRTTAGSRALRTAIEVRPCDLVIVQMLRCGWAAEVLEAVAPDVPWIFDAIDSMALHFSQSVSNFPAVLRPLVRVEAERCRRRERFLAERASLVTAVANRDLDAIKAGHPFLVPVAGKFSRHVKTNLSSPTILLSGNLGYRPTVAAAMFFASSVWPRVRDQFPDLRWVIAGARPHPRVMKLARDPRIEVHADVDDLAPFLERASIAIAPMKTGSGVPMKVLEAWAAGVPVVAHPRAAAGLESCDREQASECGVLVAETPDQWVRAIEELLTDAEAKDALVEMGRVIWSEIYSPDRIRQTIGGAISRALGARK